MQSVHFKRSLLDYSDDCHSEILFFIVLLAVKDSICNKLTLNLQQGDLFLDTRGIIVLVIFVLSFRWERVVFTRAPLLLLTAVSQGATSLVDFML